MRYGFSLLMLLLNYIAFSQHKDTRAELEIQGQEYCISVSPDERIWLVTYMGSKYYTAGIDSNWHEWKRDTSKKDNSGYGMLNRVSFFNKDTAIISGFIRQRKANNDGGYLWTSNAGKNWELLDDGGESAINDVFIGSHGKAWMGGGKKDVYFSGDFGRTWLKMDLPFKKADRVNSIYMMNDSVGVVGSENDEILTTTDNWIHAYNVETPFSQKKYTDYEYGRVSKIRIWKNLFVINQDHNIYYSPIDQVKWKEFPVKINCFEVDAQTGNLLAVSEELKVISFSSPTNFITVNEKPLDHQPMDMQIVNGSFYAIDEYNDIYKVTAKSYKKTKPYTTDYKIKDVNVIIKGRKLTWGAKANQLYISNDNGKNWYRENVANFKIRTIKLLNDSEAILWDGVKNNFQYTLGRLGCSKYFYTKPLASFISSPIKKIVINGSSSGCFTDYNNRIEYSGGRDSFMAAQVFKIEDHRDSTIKTFQNQVNGAEALRVLSRINDAPYSVPSGREFNFTEGDKNEYFELVNKIELQDGGGIRGRRSKITNKQFYLSAVKKLDTVSSSTIEAILDQPERWESSVCYLFKIEIINQAGDTLRASKHYYLKNSPGKLPWLFEYKGNYFNCYDVRFSKFIDSCLPNEFMDKGVFKNSEMILEIADYLNKQNTHRED